jgi:diguanylate cyclase (GGDEF)-like protein/PAS domain S-box-containing protein
VATVPSPAHSILVVDDEAVIAMFLERSLVRMGYRVSTAATAEEAFRKIVQAPPDVVLMDIQLGGGVDGIDAAMKIHAEFDLPVIYLSAYTYEATLLRARATNAAGFLVKPFREAELRTTLELAYEKHQADQLRRNRDGWFSSLLKSMGEGVIAFDQAGTVTYVNPAASRMTGVDPRAAVGKRVDSVFQVRLNGKDGVVPDHPWERVRDGRTVQLPAGTWIEGLDGVSTPIRDSISPLFDEQERQCGGVMVFFDTSAEIAAQAQLAHQALHDTLTGLPNRRTFLDRLNHRWQSRRRYGGAFAVLFLDVDRFKFINDSLGHLAGDQCLLQISERLKSVLRESDTLARFGGDEFTILLEQVHHSEDAILVAQRIQEALSTPVWIGQQEIACMASIGIAVSQAQHERVEDILSEADAAMYQAKTGPLPRIALFDEAMRLTSRLKIALEFDLRKAVKEEQLTVSYQPIVNLRTGNVAAFEALVRWRHPHRGILLPRQFLAIAAEARILGEINRYVWREAISEVKRWREMGGFARNLRVAVNLTDADLYQDTLPQEILALLDCAGLPPAALAVEVTEEIVVAGENRARTILERIRALGIEVHLDDFGTGYSSLSYLTRLALSSIKVDRSFVQRACHSSADVAVIRAIISLAHELSMSVVAEGVETEEQYAQMSSLGCDFAQGYYLLPPLNRLEAENLIRRTISTCHDSSSIGPQLTPQ